MSYDETINSLLNNYLFEGTNDHDKEIMDSGAFERFKYDVIRYYTIQRPNVEIRFLNALHESKNFAEMREVFKQFNEDFKGVMKEFFNSDI
jgi:hypothetical protein